MRLVPDIALPTHVHIPTTGSRPDLAPLEMARQLAPRVTQATNWKQNIAYLYGHDLMRAGYYWEAHEVWETVWLATGANCPERLLLRMLIQNANAQLKRKMGRLAAADKLDVQIAELRSDLSSRLGGKVDLYMGVATNNLKLQYNA